MIRVRFAPSPTGYLHIGSARTFIFNWLYARRHHGTMILRIDDTDVDRNTQASLDSIFEGLSWLDLEWDEFYRQSDRLDLHREVAQRIFEKGLAYRDFTPAVADGEEKPRDGATWLFNPGMREMSAGGKRSAGGGGRAVRAALPGASRDSCRSRLSTMRCMARRSKATADIEDFALLRSNGMPTYHMASCADDVDLRISHIIRGQDHLTNTFKHVLIFEAAGSKPPQFAHLPLLIAPDGSKLSKRKHGPVVSVTTYRDAGFLPHAFINFLCLLGWSPKDDREQMSRQELIDAFSFEGINRSNAVVNFTEEDPFDPKAVWLNAETIRNMPVEELVKGAAAVCGRGRFSSDSREDAASDAADPGAHQAAARRGDRGGFLLCRGACRRTTLRNWCRKKETRRWRWRHCRSASSILATAEFSHDALDAALRAGAQELKIKAGQMFQPIRVAVCGRKNAPPLFETLEVLGRETCLEAHRRRPSKS